MGKYYVNCGDEKIILTAITPTQAAVLGLQKIIIRSGEEGREEFEIFADVRVSQRGWGEHQDDFVLDTCVVLGILYLMREDDGE
jgi:hypothetical protein